MSESQATVVIVTGLSGGGKSTALNALEDLGYYCIDNLPAALVPEFARQMRHNPGLYQQVALGIDARSMPGDAEDRVGAVSALRAAGFETSVMFLTADRATLIKRFSETRRRHPLTTGDLALPAAIDRETELLAPLRETADWVIDTSEINIHQLRRQVWKCVGEGDTAMTVVLESFAFKRGVPQDVDFLFDVRNLPNPHWQPGLRELTGRDGDVRDFLEADEDADRMAADILAFLQRWLPAFADAQRSYVTVGVGCTGGRHRSVWLTERLAPALREAFPRVLVHHRELTR